ncbi:tRNA lysidine(34) synthetase TilS [Defluviimonas sp. WL0024]|uniref:tRNA(Ile)-lysidine synthase n=2 Tax=Albidovulum TaxID=205889 RepID=A0ABT3J8C4_9RHOB|nr:tRNA lysidine(34) synthetase TilS [Defluviimonas sp. WL0024]MCU9847322.1 tRNA lysidine(34) synthetase TilS [Defluviimonas sp. WL0024]MCW3783932.1 tRNA lysidine(34) synthetase TilS [Defluviimonas salinarum]
MTAGDLQNFLEKAFTPGPPDGLGVAVSGGGDSMALLHLAVDWAREGGPKVAAVTVDHRLRPEAAEEARFVAETCTRLGVAHDTLVWDHGDIDGNLQDQARRARYRLIGDWARGRGLSHVALGHTADDQAETFLMELARKAGLDGLSGMRGSWIEGGIRWTRPLLAVSRRDLRAVLTARGASWVEDPSNRDDRFTRVKARRVLEALAPLGITADTLCTVAERLGQARAALVQVTAEAAAAHARTAAGAVRIPREVFLRGLSPEVARRFLVGALLWVARADYPPRSEAVDRVLCAIRDLNAVTLGGCSIRVTEDEIAVTREPRAIAGLESGTDGLWDGRWRMRGPHESGLTVRALGAEGLAQCPDWRETGHSRAALVVTPAIWRGDTLVAAPLAGRAEGWTAEIVISFGSFLIAH